MSSGTNQSINGDGNTQVAIKEFHNNINNISSTLAGIISKVATIVDANEDGTNDTTPYDIEDKINHNNIQTFKEIIDEYGQYGTQIDGLYDDFDNSQPGFKKSVFRYFKNKYLLKKQQYHAKDSKKDSLQVVRENADSIIREIFEEFRNELKSSKNLTAKLEEIDTCALAITCHAFIQCKVLEKPKK